MNTYKFIPAPTSEQIQNIKDRHALLAAVSAAGLPDTVNLWKWHPPVRNQGSEGSCTAFATTELREWYEVKTGQPQPFVLGSPAFNYAMSRKKEGTLSKDSGSYLNDALNVLVQYGMAPESLDVYGPSTEFTMPSQQAIDAAAALKIDIVNELPIHAPGTTVADTIAHALAGGDPVAVAMIFNTAMYNPQVHGEYIIFDMKNGQTLQYEAHAYVIEGYLPDPNAPGKRLYCYQQSWGPDYGGALPGEGYPLGFGMITEDTVNALIYEAYTITIKAPVQPVPQPIHTEPVIQGLTARFTHTSVSVGQENALTVQTPKPNTKFEVSSTGPQAPYPMAFYDTTDSTGTKVLQMMFTTSGVYDVTVSSEGQTVSLTAKWE